MEKKMIIATKAALISLGLFFALAHAASAATLYLAPSAGSDFVGQSFSVGVYVSSPDQAMNAAQGTVNFPTDKLDVVSVSTANSIINLWVQQPSFSNKDGVVNFQGVVVNPGFIGNAGRIVTITFVVKAIGPAVVSYGFGSVLANDGKGTSILTGLAGATFNFVPAPPGAALQTTTSGRGPRVFSSPPVSDTGWYNFDSIMFSWNLSPDVIAVDYALATSSDPGVLNRNLPVASSTVYDVSNYSDGTWYFLLKIKGQNGWSPATVQQIQLDHTPPEPFTILPVDTPIDSPRPAFRWVASDLLSRVTYYSAKIGDGDWFDPESIRQGSAYVLPPQSPQDGRTLTVRAYDRAGNFQASTITFTVLPQNGWRTWWYKIGEFFRTWDSFISISAFLLAIGAFALIYSLTSLRRRVREEMKNEMHGFKKELERDLWRARSDEVSPTSFKKQSEHLADDIEDEIRKIDDL